MVMPQESINKVQAEADAIRKKWFETRDTFDRQEREAYGERMEGIVNGVTELLSEQSGSAWNHGGKVSKERIKIDSIHLVRTSIVIDEGKKHGEKSDCLLVKIWAEEGYSEVSLLLSPELAAGVATTSFGDSDDRSMVLNILTVGEGGGLGEVKKLRLDPKKEQVERYVLVHRTNIGRRKVTDIKGYAQQAVTVENLFPVEYMKMVEQALDEKKFFSGSGISDLKEACGNLGVIAEEGPGSMIYKKLERAEKVLSEIGEKLVGEDRSV